VQRSDAAHGRVASAACWSRRAMRIGAATTATVVLCSLVGSASGDAATTGPAARAETAVKLLAAGHRPTFAQLEARIATLSRLYRGRLLGLAGAEADARAATARAEQLSRLLDRGRRQIARLAAVGFMTGGPDPALALLVSSNPQQALYRSEIITYLAGERNARQRALRQLAAVADAAQRVAAAKIGRLRRMVDALEHQRRKIARLLARFKPQSPVIGDHMTPRMRRVMLAIDARFGPFPAIGCYRPGTSGEHPLGRACDFMLSTGGVMPTSRWIQKGYQVARWAQANAARLGIMYIIYRQHIWDIRMASAGWVLMPDSGSITANHYDHVHISVF
jgi:hypothetical protein